MTDPRAVLERLLAPELLVALEQHVALLLEEALTGQATRTEFTGKRWLTSAEAGELLSCSPDAVRMRCRRGRLEHRYMGRRLYVSAESVANLAGPGYAGRDRKAVPARRQPPGTRPRKDTQS
jgi:hypothetical protein